MRPGGAPEKEIVWYQLRNQTLITSSDVHLHGEMRWLVGWNLKRSLESCCVPVAGGPTRCLPVSTCPGCFIRKTDARGLLLYFLHRGQ